MCMILVFVVFFVVLGCTLCGWIYWFIVVAVGESFVIWLCVVG